MDALKLIVMVALAFLILRDPNKVAAWFTRRLLLALAIGAILLIGGALFGGCA